MDATVRNLDESAYRALKARAALEGVPIGELLTRAIKAFLGRPEPAMEQRSLAEVQPTLYPAGCERLSEEIDRTVYGV